MCPSQQRTVAPVRCLFMGTKIHEQESMHIKKKLLSDCFKLSRKETSPALHSQEAQTEEKSLNKKQNNTSCLQYRSIGSPAVFYCSLKTLLHCCLEWLIHKELAAGENTYTFVGFLLLNRNWEIGNLERKCCFCLLSYLFALGID